ncbi:MAG: BrnA antitoxin family protein [Terriglobales bacterium]
MKQPKRVIQRRRVRRKISRLRASAEEDVRPLTQLQQRRRRYKALKKQITLYLDADVLAWFKRAGRGYQTRINRALWEVMREERNH